MPVLSLLVFIQSKSSLLGRSELRLLRLHFDRLNVSRSAAVRSVTDKSEDRMIEIIIFD